MLATTPAAASDPPADEHQQHPLPHHHPHARRSDASPKPVPVPPASAWRSGRTEWVIPTRWKTTWTKGSQISARTAADGVGKVGDARRHHRGRQASLCSTAGATMVPATTERHFPILKPLTHKQSLTDTPLQMRTWKRPAARMDRLALLYRYESFTSRSSRTASPVAEPFCMEKATVASMGSSGGSEPGGM